MTTTTETLWHQLSKQLRHFLQQRVSDAATAEDLLQECFIRIHKNVDRIDDDRRLVSWVYQIARNLIADHFRKRNRQESQSIPEESSSHEDGANLNREISQSLKSFLPLLPEHSREVIELYEWQGLSQAEIAEQLGLSVTATKSRLQRGRKQLRKLLLDCCHLEKDRYGNIIDCQEKEANSCNECNE